MAFPSGETCGGGEISTAEWEKERPQVVDRLPRAAI